MRKKILTALAPMLAIAALAVLPTMAQATTIQVGGTSAAGKIVQAVSNNLELQAGEFALECTENDLRLFVQNPPNQADVVGGYFSGEEGTEGEPTPCQTSIPGLTIDIATNAAASFWQAHFEANDEGVLQGSEGVQYTQQYQFNGLSIATCHYYAETVPFTYNQEEPLVLTVGEGEFELEQPEQEGNLIPCPADAFGRVQVHGSFAVSSSEGTVTVDP